MKTDIVIVVIFTLLRAKKVPVQHPRVIISVDGGGGQEKVATCNRKDGLININLRKCWQGQASLGWSFISNFSELMARSFEPLNILSIMIGLHEGIMNRAG